MPTSPGGAGAQPAGVAYAYCAMPTGTAPIGPHCIITFMTIERLRNWAAERKAAAASAAAAPS